MNEFIFGFSTGLSLILAIGAQNLFVIEQGIKKNNIFLVTSICIVGDFLLIFFRFSSPGGACRPGFARETERADLGSCDSHVLFEDYGVNSSSILPTVA